MMELFECISWSNVPIKTKNVMNMIDMGLVTSN